MFNYKQVLVVRDDLKMSCGKIAVQVAHGAVSLYELAKKKRKHDKWLKNWKDEGQKKVVVKVHSKEDLFELYQEAIKLDLPAVLIQDRGMTEIPPGTYTVLGIGPAPEGEIDRVTKDLPLL
jgi:PTH2 family peptidyl-tRNA hydrolase